MMPNIVDQYISKPTETDPTVFSNVNYHDTSTAGNLEQSGDRLNALLPPVRYCQFSTSATETCTW